MDFSLEFMILVLHTSIGEHLLSAFALRGRHIVVATNPAMKLAVKWVAKLSFITFVFNNNFLNSS